MMLLKYYFLLCVISFKLSDSNPDFYTSVYSLSQLSKEEIRLTNGLKRFIQGMKEREEGIDEHVMRLYERIEKEVSENQPKEIDNPIDAFHLLKRFSDVWDVIVETTLCPGCFLDHAATDLNLTVGVTSQRLGGWPGKNELKAITKAIFRLYSMYRFDIKDFINGKILEFQTVPLSVTDVRYISDRAEDEGYMSTSVHFLEALLDHVSAGTLLSMRDQVSESSAARFVASAYSRNDMPWKSVKILEEYVKREPQNKKLLQDYEYFKARASSIPDDERKIALENDVIETNVVVEGSDVEYEDGVINKYRKLCRGPVKNITEESKLFCYLRATEIPYFKVKTELLNKKPRIFVFHDIISDLEAELIRNASIEKLERSSVALGSGGTGVSVIRVSKTGWLNDFETPFLKKLSYRISLATRLNTEFKMELSSSEMYQVLNYGIGGMYRPHLDPVKTAPDFTDPFSASGDRIATFMFYLHDVMYGGATVFPKLDTRIKVEKGSAAFWYNLDLTGEVDLNTLHAGCPVLVGSKWVSNKWIREVGQEFKRPCGLKKSSRDTDL